MIRCIDCGVSYESLGVDLVLADQEWKVLCPEDGILCANCICQRARKHGGTSIVGWISNFDYSTKQEAERFIDALEQSRQTTLDCGVTQGRCMFDEGGEL